MRKRPDQKTTSRDDFQLRKGFAQFTRVSLLPWRILGQVPSGVYLTSYIVAIFGFAYAFAQFPHDFYQSTAHVEADAESQATHLQRILMNNFWDENRPINFDHNGWVISDENVAIVEATAILDPDLDHWIDGIGRDYESVLGRGRVHVESRPMEISFIAELVTEHRLLRMIGQAQATVRIFVELESILGASVGDSMMLAEVLVVEIGRPRALLSEGPVMITQMEKALSELAVQVFLGGDGCIGVRHHTRVERDVVMEGVRLGRVSRGFTGFADGRWPRMMYLSVVTITTLGYGDIVPVTSRSRFLVALEAFMGVMLVGLFLNSLAYELRKD